MICFKIRIFALRQTSFVPVFMFPSVLWFALKFVSLRLDKHQNIAYIYLLIVVICFKIRIFALRQTSTWNKFNFYFKLWFALKFVSLRLDKHHNISNMLIISDIRNKLENKKWWLSKQEIRLRSRISCFRRIACEQQKHDL